MSAADTIQAVGKSFDYTYDSRFNSYLKVGVISVLVVNHKETEKVKKSWKRSVCSLGFCCKTNCPAPVGCRLMGRAEQGHVSPRGTCGCLPQPFPWQRVNAHVRALCKPPAACANTASLVLQRKSGPTPKSASGVEGVVPWRRPRCTGAQEGDGRRHGTPPRARALCRGAGSFGCAGPVVRTVHSRLLGGLALKCSYHSPFKK